MFLLGIWHLRSKFPIATISYPKEFPRDPKINRLPNHHFFLLGPSTKPSPEAPDVVDHFHFGPLWPEAFLRIETSWFLCKKKVYQKIPMIQDEHMKNVNYHELSGVTSQKTSTHLTHLLNQVNTSSSNIFNICHHVLPATHPRLRGKGRQLLAPEFHGRSITI